MPVLFWAAGIGLVGCAYLFKYFNSNLIISKKDFIRIEEKIRDDERIKMSCFLPPGKK